MYKEFIENLTEDEAHKFLIEFEKKFSVQSFIETHDSSYQAWPCPVCDKDEYEQEGWQGIHYI